MLQNGLVVDLLFTDIVMPGGLDGFSLAYEARQVQPDIQVLYTTGFTSLPKEVMKREVAPELLKVSMCPDLIEDRGHTFCADLADPDKLALIEYLKTF